MRVRVRRALPVAFLVLVVCTFATIGLRARQRGGGAGGAAQNPSSTGQLPVGTQPAVGLVVGVVTDVVSGKPLPGATVQLQYLGPPSDSVFMSGPMTPAPPTNAPRLVFTDDNGNFVFREVAGGRYDLFANRPGYSGGGYLQARPFSASHLFDFRDAERRSVELRMWTFGVITGTVVDEAGEPAVGVTVKVLMKVTANGITRLGLRGAALTDDRGIYRLSSLQPGDYLIGVTAMMVSAPVEAASAAATRGGGAGGPMMIIDGAVFPMSPSASVVSGSLVGDQVVDASARTTGYTSPPPPASGPMQVYPTTFFPSATTPGQATVVTLAAGQERAGVNLALNLVPAVRISGTIVGPAGPTGGMVVRAVTGSVEEFAAGTAAADVASATSDPRGRFQLIGVPAGRFTLVVGRNETARGVALPSATSSAPFLWARVPINVGEADMSDLTVPLQSGIRISGHVEFDGTSTRPTPDILARLFLLLTPLTSSETIPNTPLSPDGLFATGGAPPGKYFAVVGGPAGGTAVMGPNNPWTLRAVTYNGRNITDTPFDLESSDLTGVVATFTDKTTQLTGQVTDASGATDLQDQVVLFPADSDGWQTGAFSQRRTRTMQVTKIGAFEFDGLPEGEYFVTAIAGGVPDNWQNPAVLIALAKTATRVRLVEGDKKTQALRALPLPEIK
jgi:hypothetical protein